jgi:hypothetical protein
MLPKWQSFIGMCSQIWQYSKYETKKILKHPFMLYVVVTIVGDFFPHLLTIYFFKKGKIYNKNILI